MRPADALRIIRERAEDSGCIVLTLHARERMTERGIDFLDIQRVLRGGAVTEGPAPDLRTGDERCSVEGVVDSRRLRIGVALPADRQDVVVVTVIDLGM